jgi:hypothetical protein
MSRFLKLGLVAILALPAVSMPASAQNCRAIGSSFFCSDGRAGQRAPTTPSLNNQFRTNQLGNQRFADPQRRARSPGNTLFPTDPTRTNRIGDTVYNPDGSRCRTVGNSLTCQ